ncbi:thioredoxin family protein [Candidatus Woesearchaeota archaeon]|nr:MAG: thioredoxin family protein [Candidatus Woesearchaeota archaeon]
MFIVIVRVIGSGCPTCEKLYKAVLKLKEEGKINAEVEYSKDINEIVELGLMASPVLVVNGKPVAVGVPSEEKLLSLIKNAE